jgi:molybdopterin converting factor small subunit
VRFLAGAADIASTRLVRIPVSDGVTIREVFSEVVQMFPELRQFEGRLLFAANAEYAGYECVLHAGDQLCLIAPVSGGAYL